MTDQDVAALASEAFFYGYPLVADIDEVVRYTRTGMGSVPAAPFNQFSHARTLAGPADTFVTINNDTLYSMAQLDLSAGPLVRCTFPIPGAVTSSCSSSMPGRTTSPMSAPRQRLGRPVLPRRAIRLGGHGTRRRHRFPRLQRSRPSSAAGPARARTTCPRSMRSRTGCPCTRPSNDEAGTGVPQPATVPG